MKTGAQHQQPLITVLSVADEFDVRVAIHTEPEGGF